MLIGNYNVLNKNPGRAICGTNLSQTRAAWNKSGAQRNNFLALNQTSSIPNGYVPPSSWTISVKGGGMATYNRISGEGDITSGNLAGGLNAESDLTGSGTITNAALGLILSAVASLTGSGTLSADILGKLEAVADLVGEGDVTAALGGLASIVGDLTGSGDLAADVTAKASMSADITVSGDLVTAESCAQAVWEALAASFNNPGTMGEKLNSASSAGDPWGTLLPGAYADGTAGKILGSKVLTLVKFLGLK